MSKKFYFARTLCTHPAKCTMYVVKGVSTPEEAAEALFAHFVDVIYNGGIGESSVSNAYRLRDTCARIHHVPKESLGEKRQSLRDTLTQLKEGTYKNYPQEDIRVVEVTPPSNPKVWERVVEGFGGKTNSQTREFLPPED